MQIPTIIIGVFTIIMKTLSSNKGIALIVLIISMTLIAVLGASFVALVGTKQKGFLYQLDSYRALNIANAGVEYAIRFASDATLSDGSNFYVSPTTTKTFSFGGGTFDITYQYNNPCSNNDNVTVNSAINGMTRRVKLYNFRRYVSRFTHVPVTGTRPSVLIGSSDTVVHIPFLNNDRTSRTIQGLVVEIQGAGTPPRRLDGICFSSDPTDPCSGSGTNLNYVFSIPYYRSRTFTALDFSANISIPSDGIRYCHLRFQSTSAAVNGSYVVELYVGLTNEQPSILKFNIPPP